MSTAQFSEQQVCELGARLKAAREAQGKEISDAAFRIALSPSQLRAIESGDQRPFYSTHYFLQAAQRYADHLGLALPEMAAWRASTAPVIAGREPRDPIEVDADDMPVPDITAPGQSTPPSAVSRAPLRADDDAPSAFASTPTPSMGNAGVRKRPSLALLMVGAAIIAVAAVAVLKDDAPTPKTAPSDAPSVAPTSATQESQASAASPAPSSTDQASASSTATSSPTPTPAPTATPAAPPPAAAPVTAAAPAAISKDKKAATTSSEKDSVIQSTANAWVQIVNKAGEKTNLRIAPGEKLEFASGDTAAVVIGQSDQAQLTVRGKLVDLKNYTTSGDGSQRALVIIGNIRP